MTATRSAAIYARISSDRGGGGVNVAQQVRDCQGLAASRGVNVDDRHVFVDNDISAFSGKRRPGYEGLLDAIRAGEIDLVLAYHTDRLHRSMMELEGYIAVCDVPNVATWTVQSGDVDLSTSSGRANARVGAVFARQESERKAERLRTKHRELALAGAWGCGARVYGYRLLHDRSESLGPNGEVVVTEARRVEVVSDEAAVIRECADALLEGRASLRSMVIDLNDRGVPTLRGGRWTTSTLRQILAAARNSGQREWTPARPIEGAPVTDLRGKAYGFGPIVADGDWDSILTKEETAQIRALLSNPARRTSENTASLLTGGLLRCGRCGRPMNTRSGSGRNSRAYACIRVPGTGKCGQMSIVADQADEVVSGLAVRALAGMTFEQPDSARPSLEDARVVEARERLAVLSKMFGAGELDAATFQTANAEIQEILASTTPKRPRPSLTPLAKMPSTREGIESWWAGLPVRHQRAVLAILFDRIEVEASTKPRGYSRFQPERLRPFWHV